MEYAVLNNGVKMPMEGFGVFQVPDQAQCEQAVLDAIASGYRLIDTAAAYMNEEAVGKAMAKCGVQREELFITTKLWVQDAGYEAAKQTIQTSHKKSHLHKVSGKSSVLCQWLIIVGKVWEIHLLRWLKPL